MALLALVPVCVLYVGRPGDDAMFHVSSWMEMAAAWRSGVVWPGWAAGANFGLGEPRFGFYPPLTLVLGALVRMVVPAVAVPGVMVWGVLVVAGVGMRALAADVLPMGDRGKAAALYVSSYYVLVVAVLRFAMGELMAAALLPVVMRYFLRWMKRGRWRDAAGLAVGLAGLWLSDVPAGVAVFYVLAVVVVVEAVLRRSMEPVVGLAAAEVGAVGLSGWYLVPAMVERGKIGAVSLLHFATKEFMWGHEPAKGLTPAMGYPLWGWAAAVVGAAVWLAVREKREMVRLLAGMAVVGMGFQLPLSLPLWRWLPELGFVQFPYRFDAVLGCVLPVVALLLVRSVGARRWMFAGWVVLVMVVMGTKVGQARSGRGGVTFAGMVGQVGTGYPGYEEYATRGVTGAEGPVKERVQGGEGCLATVESWEPEWRVFGSEGSEECGYRVGVRYYPDWRVWVDGRERGVVAGRDGLVRVRVPAGRHVVELRYGRPGWVLALGAGVSGVTLMVVGGVWFAGRRRVAPNAWLAAVEAMA